MVVILTWVYEEAVGARAELSAKVDILACNRAVLRVWDVLLVPSVHCMQIWTCPRFPRGVTSYPAAAQIQDTMDSG
jgi:hypothetical protein